MNVVVGLGNPGRAYERTPHNAGFLVVDRLAERLGVTLRRKLFSPIQTAKAEHEGRRLVLIKPLTFMNRSGPAVAASLARQGAGPADVIVILDDADLPLGQIRIRRKGSGGGHKGLASVIEAIGGEEFIRVRVGVGRGKPGEDLTRYVLTPLMGEAWEVFDRAVERGAEAVLCILEKGADEAMTRYNAKAESV